MLMSSMANKNLQEYNEDDSQPKQTGDGKREEGSGGKTEKTDTKSSAL